MEVSFATVSLIGAFDPSKLSRRELTAQSGDDRERDQYYLSAIVSEQFLRSGFSTAN